MRVDEDDTRYRAVPPAGLTRSFNLYQTVATDSSYIRLTY